MSKVSPPKRNLADQAFGLLGAMVPSCGSAMKMAKLGQQRPLSVREHLVLLYNSPLCPHCRCNREKFELARQKMRQTQRRR